MTTDINALRRYFRLSTSAFAIQDAVRDSGVVVPVIQAKMQLLHNEALTECMKSDYDIDKINSLVLLMEDLVGANASIHLCDCDAHTYYEWEKKDNLCSRCGNRIYE